MIKLNDDKGNSYSFEITKFPDGTSQVWKVNPEPARFINLTVTWMFENEAELFHVCQLGYLLNKQWQSNLTLNVPYLPFGRQDKDIQNDLTFARKVFIAQIYGAGFNNIKTYDGHSKSNFIENQEPKEFLEAVAKDYDVICFSDKGALERYKNLVPEHMKIVTGEKKRNQQTGVIEGMELDLHGQKIYSEKMLVFDDICDGGGTFIGIAEKLKEHNPLKLGLAVSHGIFSKGTEVLFNAGFTDIATTNSRFNDNTPGIRLFDITEELK